MLENQQGSGGDSGKKWGKFRHLLEKRFYDFFKIRQEIQVRSWYGKDFVFCIINFSLDLRKVFHFGIFRTISNIHDADSLLNYTIVVDASNE